MFNKVPEQDPFAVSNEAEENIKLFPSFKVSVKFSRYTMIAVYIVFTIFIV